MTTNANMMPHIGTQFNDLNTRGLQIHTTIEEHKQVMS